MDGLAGLVIGFFIGALIGFFLAALVAAKANGEPEPNDGVDDVLDELFQTVQNQPKPYHDEERQEDFKRKYPQE